MAGYGDELIASGLARGAYARGKRVAFGDGKRIIWGPHSKEIFQNNPNIAHPGDEGAADIEWIEFYKGHRLYGDFLPNERRWKFNAFQCPPGEVWFDDWEVLRAYAICPPLAVVIEPTTKPMGACAGVNKQWPADRYVEVARALAQDGFNPICLGPSVHGFPDIPRVATPTFRIALAVLQMAYLYIGPEGGLHHGAAAVATEAVVLFGGFNSPASTGYPLHTNLTGGGEPCGNVDPCKHCKAAMESITVDTVIERARRHLAAVEAQPFGKKS